MIKKAFIIYLVFLVGVASAVSVSVLKTYIFVIGEPLTMAWDASENAEWYEVEGEHMEQKQIVSKPEWKDIQGTQITLNYPRSGHITWKVRACRNRASPDCSDYAFSSVNEQASNGEPWWTYGYVAGPGGAGIE